MRLAHGKARLEPGLSGLILEDDPSRPFNISEGLIYPVPISARVQLPYREGLLKSDSLPPRPSGSPETECSLRGPKSSRRLKKDTVSFSHVQVGGRYSPKPDSRCAFPRVSALQRPTSNLGMCASLPTGASHCFQFCSFRNVARNYFAHPEKYPPFSF